MKSIFLDDEREAPDGWVSVQSYEQAVVEVRNIPVGENWGISLDHDLGTEKTGYDFCKWMVEAALNGQITWPIIVNIHTRNPVGAENMRQLLARYKDEGTVLMVLPARGR